MEKNTINLNINIKKPNYPNPLPDTLDLSKIRAIKVIGKGATGTVFLAHDDRHGAFFALKVVDKSLLQFKPGLDRRSRWEISVLMALSPHPFLPSLLGCFETEDLLGWALPFSSGGDLNCLRYLQPDRVFSPSAIKFYLAEILCALEYLHSVGIAYRDLKPENVLVQGSGHVTLTDFDLSRRLTRRKAIHRTRTRSDTEAVTEIKPPPSPSPAPKKNNLIRILSYGSGMDAQKKTNFARVTPATVNRRRISFAGGRRSNSFVGTEEYVSPEIVRGEGHEYGVDWWALGILAYEMLYGKTPFCGKNRKETFDNVLTKSPEFYGKPTSLTDLIERLLEKDPMKRLGHFRGAADIKEHDFFDGLAWDLLTEVVRPPFVPGNDDVEDLMEMKTTTFDVRDYFLKQRPPSSLPSSPVHSLSSTGDDGEGSVAEF